MAEEPDIEPETAKKIFVENVHTIAPQHLTENAFRYIIIMSKNPRTLMVGTCSIS